MAKKKIKPNWEKLPAIEGGYGGCLICGYQHAVLPVGESIIAVGFGDASLSRDGETVYQEDPQHEEGIITTATAEEMAVKDPDHDWRIHLVAPMSERHYQRQGEGHWVLYKKGMGFA
jgi:hypothetical protein